ncbi:hypothetical protein ABIA68_001285 [Stenotrophomonas rhizophila]|uniref:hypothetical protein n=1 Tax=Stenotrophomonas rhizophila TaxID=216778 RepID=UPI0033911DAE
MFSDWILIAVVASVPASQTSTDWKWLVPVASLVLGFGLKWLQDIVTERSRDRKALLLRQEMRRDALKARRAESERANLLELQPLFAQAIQGLVLSFQAAQENELLTGNWHIPNNSRHLQQNREARMKMQPILSRLHNRTLALRLQDSHELGKAIVTAIDEEGANRALLIALLESSQLMDSIGAEIRHSEADELAAVDKGAEN